MNRRIFLKSLAVTGFVGAIGTIDGSPLSKLAAAAGKTGGRKGIDENLVVFISDLHTNPDGYQPDKLRKVVSQILALRPLPANVIALGDLAYLTGKPKEYAALKPILQPLEDAGMTLTLAMGNHDRRETFAEVFPTHASKSLLKDRLVYKVVTPKADFIILDSLRQGEDASTWITDGAIDANQAEWLKQTLAGYRDKSVFVCSHHPINETKVDKIITACPCCAGYIYGHNHRWMKTWVKNSYSSRNMVRTLCLPSTGHWGDIGFVTMRLEKTTATASLHQNEFFFPKPLAPGEKAPAEYAMIMEENKGAVCSFPLKTE